MSVPSGIKYSLVKFVSTLIIPKIDKAVIRVQMTMVVMRPLVETSLGANIVAKNFSELEEYCS